MLKRGIAFDTIPGGLSRDEGGTLRILVLSNLYPPDVLGGYELACSQVVEALRDRGHETRVVCARPRQLVPRVEGVNRRFHLVEYWSRQAMGRHQVAYQMHESEARFFNAHNVHVLLAEIEDFEPDVVYLNNILGLGGLGLVAAIQYLKLPWVWHLGDSVPRELCSMEDGLIPELGARFAADVRGTYVSVSGRLIEEIEHKGLKLNRPLELIPYWIHGERPRTRTLFYQPGNHLRIMSAGRLSPQKGTDLLIEAAAQLIAWGIRDFSVDFYGHVPDPSFAQQIRGLGLEDHVQIMGSRPQAELLNLYENYDIFAFPTLPREPFGLVPLEAASRSCLPVISESCGIAEWLVHGVHCIKAARTPEAFAQVFRDVFEGKTPFQAIVRRAREAAWNDFHSSVIIPKIEALMLDASTRDRSGAGLPADAYRMARMAEQMSFLLIQEALLTS